MLLSLTGHTELMSHFIRPLVQGHDPLRGLNILLMSGFQRNSNSIVSNEPASSIVGQGAFFGYLVSRKRHNVTAVVP